jgi:hypothetical protein
MQFTTILNMAEPFKLKIQENKEGFKCDSTKVIILTDSPNSTAKSRIFSFIKCAELL